MYNLFQSLKPFADDNTGVNACTVDFNFFCSGSSTVSLGDSSDASSSCDTRSII